MTSSDAQRKDAAIKPIIVIKLGTSSIVNEKSLETLDSTFRLASEVVADLHNDGYSVAIVCSGALAIGMKRMGLVCKPKDLNERKALAAIGQPKLIALWEDWFASQGIPVAQVLLTRDNMSRLHKPGMPDARSISLKASRLRFAGRNRIQPTFRGAEKRTRLPSALRMLKVLLRKGVVPILNENDAVTGKRDMFGNNDELSAVVAGLLHAKYVFILTDVEGLYTANPRLDEDAKLIPIVHSVKDVRQRVCSLTQGSDLGTGGMATKITAAEQAVRAGVEAVICSSSRPGIVREIISYDIASRGTIGESSTVRPAHTKFTCAKE